MPDGLRPAGDLGREARRTGAVRCRARIANTSAPDFEADVPSLNGATSDTKSPFSSATHKTYRDASQIDPAPVPGRGEALPLPLVTPPLPPLVLEFRLTLPLRLLLLLLLLPLLARLLGPGMLVLSGGAAPIRGGGGGVPPRVVALVLPELLVGLFRLIEIGLLELIDGMRGITSTPSAFTVPPTALAVSSAAGVGATNGDGVRTKRGGAAIMVTPGSPPALPVPVPVAEVGESPPLRSGVRARDRARPTPADDGGGEIVGIRGGGGGESGATAAESGLGGAFVSTSADEGAVFGAGTVDMTGAEPAIGAGNTFCCSPNRRSTKRIRLQQNRSNIGWFMHDEI